MHEAPSRGQWAAAWTRGHNLQPARRTPWSVHYVYCLHDLYRNSPFSGIPIFCIGRYHSQEFGNEKCQEFHSWAPGNNNSNYFTHPTADFYGGHKVWNLTSVFNQSCPKFEMVNSQQHRRGLADFAETCYLGALWLHWGCGIVWIVGCALLAS